MDLAGTGDFLRIQQIFLPRRLVGRYGHIVGRHGEGIGSASVVCQSNGVAGTVDGTVGRSAGQGHSDGLARDKVLDTSVLHVFCRGRRHAYATGAGNLVSTLSTLLVNAVHAAVGKAFNPAALQAQMSGFYRTLCK